jgi:hypothetical protein
MSEPELIGSFTDLMGKEFEVVTQEGVVTVRHLLAPTRGGTRHRMRMILGPDERDLFARLYQQAERTAEAHAAQAGDGHE